MRKHFLLLFIWILLPFINSSAEGNRANNSLLDEDNLSYCVPEGNVNRRGSPTERRLQTITISGATLNNEVAPFSNTLNNIPQPNVYLDVTDAIITASQGDEITVSWNFRNAISWMHYYIYIDYDQDGVFNEEDELVSFTYFNASSEDDAPNSIGEMVSAGASFTTAPKFTIPQDVLTGKTRLRFKVDWNSKNPCGHPGPQNIIGANNGTIVDYIIDIHPASAVATSTITLPESVENGSLTVKAGEREIANGETVENGTELTFTAIPDPGYVLDYLNINDVPFTESTYTVTGDAVITVAFVEEAVEAASKAIHVPANDGDIKYQFRFDDIVLGEHVNGTNNKWDNGIVNRGDNRARNFTMSVWIKPLNKNGELFGHAQAPFYGAQGTFGVGINSNNNLVLKARAWLDEGSCNGITDLTSEETLQLNEWAFLTVAVDDDARTIKLYKNGVLLVAGDLSATSDGTEAHGIGLLQDECVFFAGNGNASCDVDEVQVWNKTLSEEEILTSMESFKEAPENLIAFYKFDENSIENIPNQGTGVECTAGLVSGTSKYQGAPYWAEVYTCTPTQATLVDGHILPKVVVNYVSETDHGSFVIKDGENTVAPGSKVTQGTTLTIEATPAEGYQLKSIKVNDVEIEGNTFVLEEESTITVEFAEAYIVKYTASENGTLEVKENDVIIENNTGVASGTVLTIIAKPADNAVLSAFTINGVDKLSEIKETMEMNVTVSEALDIKAEFSPAWKVTCNITGEGSVKIEDKDGNVYESGVSSILDGSMITLTFTPEDGYKLTDLTLEGTSYIQHVADGKFIFEIDGDYTFDVVFSQITSLQNNPADAVAVRYAAGTLQVTGMNAGDRLDIYDVAGNYVRTSEEADTNVSDLANGCYLVKVTTGNSVKTVKFIKR